MLPAAAASSPFAAAMAIAASEQYPLPSFFLRPVFLLHGVSAASHLLLALAVAGRLLLAGRGKDSGAAGRAGGFRWCRVAVCTTWALAAFEVCLAASSWVSWYLDGGGGAGWAPDAVADQVDAAARGLAWLLLAAYLQLEYGRGRPEERFPAPLRLWWALFLLLSVLAVAVHAVASIDGLPVPAHSWALDAVTVLAAVVLLVSGLLGKREAGGSASEEPLLNGASEVAGENNGSDSVDASMFTVSDLRTLDEL